MNDRERIEKEVGIKAGDGWDHVLIAVLLWLDKRLPPVWGKTYVREEIAVNPGAQPGAFLHCAKCGLAPMSDLCDAVRDKAKCGEKPRFVCDSCGVAHLTCELNGPCVNHPTCRGRVVHAR